MPPVICNARTCNKTAVLKRPKTGDPLCKECFFYCFEVEIHMTIVAAQLFKPGYKVAIGASGGKDSTVLAYVLKLLNDRYKYGLNLYLLSIDEGITGYRDDSLETVKQNRDDYQLPLKILSYKDLYGWTMDDIVAQIGKTNNCTFCGVFRRQALDRGAALIGADMIVTGHNADDMAETVVMNILRGDIARFSRCTDIITEGEGTIPRCKPLKYTYEKEIVMYAHFKKLVYFSTECIYSPNAFRGYAREYIKQLERIRPSCIMDIIYSGEVTEVNVKLPKRRFCTKCGFVASQEICKACVLLEGLNTGNPTLGLRKSNKAKRAMGMKIEDGSENKDKKKLNRDPSYVSKKKLRREEKKKKMLRDSCSSNCKSEPCSIEKDLNEKESKSIPKTDTDEEIPREAFDELPIGLDFSSDEESRDKDSNNSNKKEERAQKNQNKCRKGCASSCMSTFSKPTTLKDNESDDDSTSNLVVDIDEELSCGAKPRKINSSDENKSCNAKLNKDCEFVECKCKYSMETKLEEESEPKIDKKFLDFDYVHNLIEEALEEEKDDLDTLIDNYIAHVESKFSNMGVMVKVCTDKKEAEDYFNSVLHPSDHVAETKVSQSPTLHETEKCSKTENDSPVLESLKSLTIKESALTNSDSIETVHIKENSGEQTQVVKANAKRVGPSLLLPEMVNKHPNHLDF